MSADSGARARWFAGASAAARRRRRLRGLCGLALALCVAPSAATGSPLKLAPGHAAPKAVPAPPAKPQHKHHAIAPARLPSKLPSAPIYTLTMSPVGLSMEYPLLAHQMGSGACPPPALIAELKSLGSPPLRIGGNSQDLTAPPGALADVPLAWEEATLYSLPPDFWAQLHCLLAGSPDPLSIGLNAKYGGLPWAEQMVAGARSAASAGLEFSDGNEPDLYYLPNYESLGLSHNSEAQSASLYIRIAQQLRAATGSLPLVGPEIARPGSWRGQLARTISGAAYQTVGVHLYALSACGGKHATLAELLSPAAIDAPASLAWVVSAAAAAHRPALIGEANSVACGGQAGVSDSPGAAVWAVGFVLNALQTGFREVRFHFSNGYYDPFVVEHSAVVSRPIASALIALNTWLPIGATLQPIAGVGTLAAYRIIAGGKSRYIFENEHTSPQQLLLFGSHALRAEVLDASSSGIAVSYLAPHAGRILVTLPANSVLSVA